jgi:hypothetical protein
MPWTIKDAIDQARDHIQDTREDCERHSDAKLIRFFNSAIADARKLRPDLFLPNISDPVDLYTVADLGDPDALPTPIESTAFPLDPMYFTAVTEYVAGLVGVGDDEFAVEGRAILLLNRFSQKLISKGA